MTLDWLSEPRFHLWTHDFSIANCAGFLLALLAGFGLSAAIQSDTVRHFFSRLGVDKRYVALTTAVLALLLFIGSVFIGLALAGLPVDWEARLPGIPISLALLVQLVVSLVVVFWLASVAKRFLFNRFLSNSGMDRALQYAVAQVTGYVVLVLGVLIVLQNSGINLSTLTVFAGALGVGLGLGLQNIASNFVSGLVILAERPIKIGDRVDVDGIEGMITKIRARSTSIVTNDNIAIIVPNSRFIENPVINWSHGDPKVRFRIPFGVAYGTDIDLLKKSVVSVAAAHPASLALPAPELFFDSFGDSALNFELVVWSDEMSYRPRRFRSDLNFAIERALREAHIEIPFPQRDLHLRTGWPAKTPDTTGKF